MSIEETIRRRWEKFEPMRIRMMKEAYDCADRNEVEAYNSVKVMCGEVLRMAEELVLAEREACAKIAQAWDVAYPTTNYGQCIANEIRNRT